MSSDPSADPTVDSAADPTVDPAVDPAVEQPAESRERIARLKTASYYFDNAIRVPGTRYRVGIDPLLGLLPVVGDAPGVALSAYIVAEAAALGVPRETIARMLVNVLVDAVVGSVPVVGDLFDAAWKANAQNVALLEARHGAPAEARHDRTFLVAVFLVVAAGVCVVLLAVSAVAWVVLARLGVVG